MTSELVAEGLEFAHKNNMIPVFLGDPADLLSDFEGRKLHIQISEANASHVQRSEVERYIPVYSLDNTIEPVAAETCIVLIRATHLSKLPHIIDQLTEYHNRINIVKRDVCFWDDSAFNLYKEFIVYCNESGIKDKVSINILDHENRECLAGISEFTLAPNGKIYICPGFFFEDSAQSVGNLANGINAEALRLLQRSKSSQCIHCSSTHCVRCSLSGLKSHGLLNKPALWNCKIHALEAR